MMMMGPSLVVQAALLALVGGYTIIHHPILYQHPLDRPVVGGIREINARSGDTNLPCPGDGFYVHPQNCSRFYRCVDYANTGALYSRYFFECPTDHIFLTAAQTCLPGTCIGLVQAVVPPPPPQDPTPFPPGHSPPITETPSVSEEPMTVFPPAPSPEVMTEAPVQTEAPTEAPVTVLAPEESCPRRYVQHPDYCNLYNPCEEPHVRYVCPTGTVFDEPRQMCRISALDDGLCDGKEVFKHSFLLRSENVGTHVRLPDSFILPTVRQSSRPTPRPSFLSVPSYVRPIPKPSQNFIRPFAGSAQTFVRPAASPAQFFYRPTPRPIKTSVEEDSNYQVNQPDYRPLIQRPAQTRFRPDYSPETFEAAFKTSKFNFLQPIERAAQTPAGTRPLALVRRPEGHLHFPHYEPFDIALAK